MTTALWPWEKRFVPARDILPGVIAPRHTLLLTLLLTGLLCAWWFVSDVPWGYVLLALPCARLIALDLTHHILPDIYTLPLLITGAAIAGITATGDTSMLGFAVALGMGLLMLLAAWIFNQQAGVGGGDLKLLAAIGMWAGFPIILLVMALGCICSLPLLVVKQRYIPLGPGLILAWWAWIMHKFFLLDLIMSLPHPI